MLTELQKSKDIMENPMGFTTSFELPIIKEI
jgi:hypothetical protein